MRKKLTILLFTAITVVACHESLEERASREAREYTQKYCPTPVIDNTRTDSLTFNESTHTLEYWYSLSGNADDAQTIKAHESELKATLLNGVKGSTQLKVYKENGFNVRYVYHSTSNPSLVLLDVTFTEKDY